MWVDLLLGLIVLLLLLFVILPIVALIQLGKPLFASLLEVVGAVGLTMAIVGSGLFLLIHVPDIWLGTMVYLVGGLAILGHGWGKTRRRDPGTTGPDEIKRHLEHGFAWLLVGIGYLDRAVGLDHLVRVWLLAPAAAVILAIGMRIKQRKQLAEERRRMLESLASWPAPALREPDGELSPEGKT